MQQNREGVIGVTVEIPQALHNSCAPLRSPSPLYPYPLSEHTLTGRGARNTAVPAAGLIAVSIRSSSAELPCRGLADFACAIHSQHMAAQENRAGAIGVLGRKIKLR
jgi:hypothetical protein